MKQLYILIFVLTLSVQFTIAQTVTMNWTTSLSSSWDDGDRSGSANNVGNSGVKVSIAIANTQNNSYGSFDIFTSPAVTNTYVSALGSNAKNLAIGVDWTQKSKSADITITFDKAVKNVKFNVADIDKLSATSKSYIDEITVTGSNNGTAVTIPTLSKLVSGTALVIDDNTATANPANNRGGNSNSNSTDQSGTVVVDFGNTILTQVKVHYHNNDDADDDPGQQFILLGAIAFAPASTLPLTLTSFNGALKNNTIQLNWTTAQEENLDKFIVEKSPNGIDWQTLTTVKASGNSNTTKEYNTTDPAAASVNFYRLKQLDIDGKYTYSQTIRIHSNGNERSGIRLYPNPATNATTLNINTENKVAAHIKIYNQLGLQLQQLQRSLIAGSNNIPVPGISTLPTGTYFITVEDETGKKIGTTQFVKQ